jgi:PAS domain S-box-containing protein
MAKKAENPEALFRHLMDAAPVMIWVSGPDKLCNWFNQPWLEFTGRTIEQERGNGWTEGVHPDDLSRCLEIYTAHFDQRRPFKMDYRLRRADGEYRWILDTGVPRSDRSGEFLGYIGSCTDITALKQVELGLKQTVTSRDMALDTLDRVTFTMAHEFRNVLAAVQLYVGAMRETAASDPGALPALVDQAQASLDEGDAIVRGLLEAVRHPARTEIMHINQAIAESLAIFRGAAGDETTLVIDDLSAAPDDVIADPAQFRSALLNLITNARDAMPKPGGTITVGTRSLTLNPGTSGEPDLAPGRYVIVFVSDTGNGMDESLLPRIFEPFFTTKGPQGTGIGLYQVRAFVRNAKGIERVTSVPGEGTTIRLYLPEAAQSRNDRTTPRRTDR